MVSPNAKGSAFERKICRQLSMWVSHYKQTDCFWRTPNSGGKDRVSHTLKTDKNKHAGDITATDPLGDLLVRLFVIECKSYNNLQWQSLIYGGKGKLRGWWNRLYEDATALRRMPMLIAKQDYQKPIMILDRNGRLYLNEAHPNAALRAIAVFPSEDISVYSMADVLVEVDFRKVRRYAKGL